MTPEATAVAESHLHLPAMRSTLFPSLIKCVMTDKGWCPKSASNEEISTIISPL